MARYYKESNFKKSYIPVILSSALLLVLIVGLGYVIFFMKDKNQIKSQFYKEKIDDYSINVQMADFAENEVVDFNYDVFSKEEKTIKVKNHVVNGFVDSNAIIANINTKFVKDDLLVYTNHINKEPFISLLTTDGKIKWHINLKNKEYPNLAINSINVKDKYLYVIYTNDTQVLGQKISLDGKADKMVLIKKFDKINYLGSVINNNSIIYYHTKSGFIEFYKSDLNFKLENKSKSLYDYNKEHVAQQIYPIDFVSYKDKAYLGLIMYPSSGEEHLIIKVDYDNDKIDVSKVNDVIDSDNMYQLIDNKLYTYNMDKVYITKVEDNSTDILDYSFLDDNINEEDETNLYSLNKVYAKDDYVYLYNSNEYAAVLDKIVNGKLRKRIQFILYENKISGLPLNIYEKNNKLIIVYIAGDSNLYINEYEMK